jgi:triosephosphate isomerase (TIM)
MARKKIVAGNWKMNKTLEESVELAKAVAAGKVSSRAELVLCVPFVNMQSVQKVIAKKKKIHLGAQNMHQEAKGAFTGEISADMLLAIGANHVIIGHSERRQYFNESDELLAQKVNAALAKGLTPIFCCGESLEIRQANTHVKFVAEQLKNSLYHLSATDFAKIVIAYEPIWAIGTGLTASPEQAQEMHAAIRKEIKRQYGNDIAKNCSILYGGSCNAKNAKELFAQRDVDGGLIGGASLVADDFLTIANSF